MLYKYNIYLKNKSLLLMDIYSTNNREKKVIFAINSKKFVLCEQFEKNYKTLSQASYLIPDGQGIVWLLKKNGVKIKKIAGVDLMNDICKLAPEYNKNIFLFGSSEYSVSTTIKKFEEKYPSINFTGYLNGYQEDNNHVIEKINESKAEILFVALGSMMQEEWIVANKDKLKYVEIIQAVGGSFDIYSGLYKRAPKIFITLGLEWLFRIVQQPKRLSDLQLIYNYYKNLNLQKK